MTETTKPVAKGSINQFSTDLDNPPEFRKNDTPFPEHFKITIRQEFPDLKPAVIKGKPRQEVFAAAEAAAHGLLRTEVTHQEESEGCIEGVYATMFTRTKEDFTIHVTRGAADDEFVVNMRTRSRSSGGLDGNERIVAFLNALAEELQE